MKKTAAFSWPAKDEMNSKPGTYCLVLQCAAEARVQIGRKGLLGIRPGYYFYVGSAFGPGGVLARVSRHCRKQKTTHWHIDYLREYTQVVMVWFSHSAVRLEHHWAGALEELKGVESLKGFGSSDCSCASHLFFCSRKLSLAEFKKAVSDSVQPWTCDQQG